MRIVALFPALLVGACAAGAADDRIWMRADGVSIRGRPELVQRFELDLTACRGETFRADVVSDAPLIRRQVSGREIMAGCMAQRGYLLRTPPPGHPITKLER